MFKLILFPTDDVNLIKSFNKNSVKASLRKLDDDFQRNLFTATKFEKLGVFLDLDCYSKKMLTLIFSLVRYLDVMTRKFWQKSNVFAFSWKLKYLINTFFKHKIFV